MTEGYVDVESGRLFYENAGTGPAVVFIHPGLWDRRTWDDQFDVFAERFRAIRYDVRGYGLSSKPKAEEHQSVQVKAPESRPTRRGGRGRTVVPRCEP